MGSFVSASAELPLGVQTDTTCRPGSRLVRKATSPAECCNRMTVRQSRSCCNLRRRRRYGTLDFSSGAAVAPGHNRRPPRQGPPQ